MKKSLLILGLLGLVSLSIYGWGCVKKPSFQAPTNQVQDTEKDTITTDTAAAEPTPLAYLLLTKSADVVVYRGDQQTKGMHEMELYAGDEVQVVSGEARLLYPDTGMSVLLPGTKVQLVPEGDPKDGGLGLDVLLEVGKVWTRLERLLGSDESFSVTGSNVVATVRGTAFSMSLENGEVDVEVAHSQVKVTSRVMLNVGSTISNSVTLAAGSGMRLDPKKLTKTADIKSIMRKNIRTLTSVERQGLGYRFGQIKLDPALLKKPRVRIRWSKPIALDKLRDRISTSTLDRWQSYAQWIIKNQTILRATETQLQANPLPVRFVAPLNDVNLLNVTPTTTPATRGPSS